MWIVRSHLGDYSSIVHPEKGIAYYPTLGGPEQPEEQQQAIERVARPTSSRFRDRETQEARAAMWCYILPQGERAVVFMLTLVLCHTYRHGEEKQVRAHFLSERMRRVIEFERRVDRMRQLWFLFVAVYARWVPIVHSLPVSKSCSLDQPMSRDVAVGVVDLGGCWPCFQDLENRKNV